MTPRQTPLFEDNPLAYLASYGITTVWVGWLISGGHLTDADNGRPPREDDVLEPESLCILPKRVHLKKKEPPIMGVEQL